MAERSTKSAMTTTGCHKARASTLVRRLQDAIKSGHKYIVVIGDTMVDRWVHGTLSACQDGCHKFVQSNVVEVPGGAANADNCLQNWGVETVLYGFFHKDRPVKTRYVVGDKIAFRIDDDLRTSYRYNYSDTLKNALKLISEGYNKTQVGGVLISDYDKGFMPVEFIREVAELCRAHSIPCVADCKRRPDTYRGCTILKANEDYANQHFKSWCDELLVVTRGGSGPYYYGSTMPDGPPVKCLNHVGAGDCFSAHLTLALAYGLTMDEAILVAHSAGRVYVQHLHNRRPRPDEIEADLTCVMEMP